MYLDNGWKMTAKERREKRWTMTKWNRQMHRVNDGVIKKLNYQFFFLSLSVKIFFSCVSGHHIYTEDKIVKEKEKEKKVLSWANNYKLICYSNFYSHTVSQEWVSVWKKMQNLVDKSTCMHTQCKMKSFIRPWWSFLHQFVWEKTLLFTDSNIILH